MTNERRSPDLSDFGPAPQFKGCGFSVLALVWIVAAVWMISLLAPGITMTPIDRMTDRPYDGGQMSCGFIDVLVGDDGGEAGEMNRQCVGRYVEERHPDRAAVLVVTFTLVALATPIVLARRRRRAYGRSADA